MKKSHHKVGEIARASPNGLLAAMKKVLSRKEGTTLTPFEERILDWQQSDMNAFMAKYVSLEARHRQRQDEFLKSKLERGEHVSQAKKLIGLVDRWLEENNERQDNS